MNTTCPHHNIEACYQAVHAHSQGHALLVILIIAGVLLVGGAGYVLGRRS